MYLSGLQIYIYDCLIRHQKFINNFHKHEYSLGLNDYLHFEFICSPFSDTFVFFLLAFFLAKASRIQCVASVDMYTI